MQFRSAENWGAAGRYIDRTFGAGVVTQLDEIIAQVKAAQKQIVPYFGWQITLTAGKTVKVGSGNNVSNAKPIVLKSDLDASNFVGVDKLQANYELYQDLDLENWVKEWQQATVETNVADDGESIEETDLDTIEGFDI